MHKKASYPKRLYDKTMKKRYADAGFDEEKLDFLHKFFQAAVNLYGVIKFVDLAQIYEEILKAKIITLTSVTTNSSNLLNWFAGKKCLTMFLNSMSFLKTGST